MTKPEPNQKGGDCVFFLAALVIGAATVPLAKGRLGAFADLRLRWGPVLLSAVALQVVILRLIPDHPSTIHEPLHVASYVLIGVFMSANIRVSGMWIIAFGGLCNAAVITANGGVMYVSRTALETVGLYPLPDAWLNAAVLEHPKLALLGDIFPIPLLETVVSFGDILIAIGAIALVHGISGSRLIPSFTRALRRFDHTYTTSSGGREVERVTSEHHAGDRIGTGASARAGSVLEDRDSTSRHGERMIETPNTGRKLWQAKTRVESRRRNSLKKT